LEETGVDGRIILIFIWTGFIWLRIGTGRGYCECGNERSVSIKCAEFLD
jgi:hypothetical protein